MVHLFETRQQMKIRIFQANSSDLSDETKFPIVGEADFVLSQLFQSKETGKVSLKLTKNGGQATAGQVTIIGESLVENRDALEMNFSADITHSPNWVTTPSPYFMISKLVDSNDWVKVFTSPVREKTMQADWGAMTIPIAQLCNSDKHCPLKVQVFDGARLLGESITFVEAIENSASLPLTIDNLKTGHINTRGKIIPVPTFTEVRIDEFFLTVLYINLLILVFFSLFLSC
jgi:hypothetical protein